MNSISALTGVSSGGGTSLATPAPRSPSQAPLVVETVSLSSCTEIRAAWTDLASRSAEPNPFFEPDFALAAAQHLVAFRDVEVLLAWQGAGGVSNRRLVGLLPYSPRNRLFGVPEIATLRDPRILCGAPLIDAVLARPVAAALLDRTIALGRRQFVLPRLDAESPLLAPLRYAAGSLGWTATVKIAEEPFSSAIEGAAGTDIESLRQALAREGVLALKEPGSRAELRDAVELLLALDASGARAQAGKAMLQDTREAGFLRAMTRALARTRQCGVSLLMLDERPIAAALVLGRSRRGWLYMTTQDDTYAGFAPLPVLLAMMRRAAPGRQILTPAHPALGLAANGLIELSLTPASPRAPRDLASRAREALRFGFRA